MWTRTVSYFLWIHWIHVGISAVHPLEMFGSGTKLVYINTFYTEQIEPVSGVSVRQYECADQSHSANACSDATNALHFMYFTSSAEQPLGALFQQP